MQVWPVGHLCVCWCRSALQWSYKVWKAQHVLGGLYERIYDIIRSRGVPPAEETVLWACLARLKDPATGQGGAAGGGQVFWVWYCQPGCSFNVTGEAA